MRFDQQPLPDYKQWEDSGELHYGSYETRHDFSTGPWDECPGLFLPEKVLDSCFQEILFHRRKILKLLLLLAGFPLRKQHNTSITPENN